MTMAETSEKLDKEKGNIRFSYLVRVCQEYFGDPRLNLQEDKGKAKPYQVDQVIEALSKLRSMKKEK